MTGVRVLEVVVEEPGTWNLGTIVWLAFGVLLAWGLLAALWEWLADLPTTVRDWSDARRRRAASGYGPEEPDAEPADTSSEHVRLEHNLWSETGYGPAGDPKLWCGTCAEAAKRADTERS